MNLWINTFAYAAAAALAFRGFAGALGKPEERHKAFTMLLLALFLGADAFTWHTVGRKLFDEEAQIIYPWWMHAIDVFCLVAVLIAVVKLANSKGKVDPTELDEDMRHGLIAFAIYACGVAVYWAVMWIAVEDGSRLDAIVQSAFMSNTPISVLAPMTLSLYCPVLAVTLGLLWSKRATDVRPNPGVLGPVRVSVARCLWCAEGRVWPSLACWIAVALGTYLWGGPTRLLLIKRHSWPGFTEPVIGYGAPFIVLGAVVLGVWSALPTLQGAARTLVSRARQMHLATMELLVG